MTKTEAIKIKLNNMIWHIEHNREVCGDKSVLDAVYNSLKNLKEQI